jgi:hypothetical protein
VHACEAVRVRGAGVRARIHERACVRPCMRRGAEVTACMRVRWFARSGARARRIGACGTVGAMCHATADSGGLSPHDLRPSASRWPRVLTRTGSDQTCGKPGRGTCV